MNKIKLLVADDHQVVRESLVTTISKDPEIDVIDEASDGLEALKKYEELKPDLILMDLNMPKLNGIEATRRLKEKFEDVKVVILSMHDNRDYILDALSVGIEGYILKMSNLREVFKAIKEVHNGGNYFDKNITGKLKDKFDSEYDLENEKIVMEKYGITQREMEIIKMLTETNGVDEISDKLNISLHTVRNHKRNILNKLELSSTAELIIFAFKQKIVKV